MPEDVAFQNKGPQDLPQERELEIQDFQEPPLVALEEERDAAVTPGAEGLQQACSAVLPSLLEGRRQIVDRCAGEQGHKLCRA